MLLTSNFQTRLSVSRQAFDYQLDKENKPQGLSSRKHIPLPDFSQPSTPKPLLTKRVSRTVLNPKNCQSGFCIDPRNVPDQKSTLSKPEIDNSRLLEEIRAHAQSRTTFFTIESVAMHGLAEGMKRKDDVIVGIGRAHLQIGKGCTTHHAAHSNASAGRVDNFREVLQEEIIHEGISPKTAEVLTIKGFPLETIEHLSQEHQNPEIVHATFDSTWPRPLKRIHSVSADTDLELTLNSTTILPRSVNLSSDKGLESVLRPKAKELYQLLIKGEISSVHATKLYRQYTIDYFEKNNQHLKLCVKSIENYSEKLNNLKHIENVDDKKLIADLMIMNKAIEKINSTPGHFIDSLIEAQKPRTFIFTTKLKENKKFLRQLLSNLRETDVFSAEKFVEFVNQHFLTLENEIKNQLKCLQTLLLFSEAELKGSLEEPDFIFLFGKFNKETGKREFKEEFFKEWQEHLLKPKRNLARELTPDSTKPPAEKLCRIEQESPHPQTPKKPLSLSALRRL